jgi:hypothetical protein
MTNIKEVIERGINVGYAVKRYEVKKVDIYKTLITVYYFDNLFQEDGSCEFSF